MELKSLIDGKKTRGSVSNIYNNNLKGGTIYGLKIKTGYTKKIINWFKKMYKKKVWANYINKALSNCKISLKLIFFAYENKGKLPTLKDIYGTKIFHYGESTKKNKKTHKKSVKKSRKKNRKKTRKIKLII